MPSKLEDEDRSGFVQEPYAAEQAQKEPSIKDDDDYYNERQDSGSLENTGSKKKTPPEDVAPSEENKM